MQETVDEPQTESLTKVIIAVSQKSLRDQFDHINFYNIIEIDDEFQFFTLKRNAISTNLYVPDDKGGLVRPQIFQEPSMRGNSFVWVRKTNENQYVTL